MRGRDPGAAGRQVARSHRARQRHGDAGHYQGLLPTILEIARVDFGGQSSVLSNHDGVVELGPELDGRSFDPILRGESGEPDRPLFWTSHTGGAA